MRNNEKPKGLRPLQKQFFSLFGQEGPKPIPPKLVRIYKYPLSAMISQLLFWKGLQKRKDGLIYKTEKDFLDELGLSSAEQKLAIKKGKRFGFLRVERKGIPAKRHYFLNYDKLVEVTINEAEKKGVILSKSWYQMEAKNQQRKSGNNQSNTDNTTETTARYHMGASSTGDIMAKRLKRG